MCVCTVHVHVQCAFSWIIPENSFLRRFFFVFIQKFFFFFLFFYLFLCVSVVLGFFSFFSSFVWFRLPTARFLLLLSFYLLHVDNIRKYGFSGCFLQALVLCIFHSVDGSNALYTSLTHSVVLAWRCFPMNYYKLLAFIAFSRGFHSFHFFVVVVVVVVASFSTCCDFNLF